MQDSDRHHAFGHALGSQNRTSLSKGEITRRCRSWSSEPVSRVLEEKVSTVRVDPVPDRYASGMDESFLELINIQQHVDCVELNINVVLIQNGDRHIVLCARLDIQCGSKGA